MMEGENQGLRHMVNMNVDQADLHGLSSQGKSQNTANPVTIDRQKNLLKCLAKDCQIT